MDCSVVNPSDFREGSKKPAARGWLSNLVFERIFGNYLGLRVIRCRRGLRLMIECVLRLRQIRLGLINLFLK